MPSHLCSNCVHRGVCAMRMKAEKAVLAFKDCFSVMDLIRAKTAVGYDITHCKKYREDDDD